jgi:ParB/RepB/Spo0J family partition protein
MDYRVHDVFVSQIDTTDQTFRITTSTDIADLAASINSVGLLHPPLLVKKGRAYRIIAGFRRVAACQCAALTRIPARIDDGQRSEGHHALMAIVDNASQRQLNVVEQARALGLIQRFVKPSDQQDSITGILGLPASRSAVERLSQIVNMPESLQMAIVEGSIALPVAISINKLQSDDAVTVATLLQRVHTGLNNQRELLERIVELCLINETSASRLLEQDRISTILTDDESPMPQRVQHLRRVLKTMRYPELSKAEAAFSQAFKALSINPSIQLQPPRFFEGKTYRLSMSIHSRKQLKSLLADLEKIADHPHILPE